VIKIGHAVMDVPLALFAETIVVDDRPSIGGGLPDFWEGTLARLIARLEVNPNVRTIYLVGNRHYARQTVTWLTTKLPWRDEEARHLSLKTGLPLESIKEASRRIRGHIRVCRTTEPILPDLSRTLLEPARIVLPAQSTVEPESANPRKLSITTRTYSLPETAGCVASTIAEVFPVAVQIVRSSEERESVLDQEGVRLKELLDFRILLTDPERDQVPSYYRGEAKSLESYFKAQFQHKNGLFLAPLRSGGQLGDVLRHLAEVITDTSRQFATRRAVLVIPHKTSGSDLTPLGLISVRLSPRFQGGRVVIHSSYSWRTVEALVGLPYSLYGSVRFTQSLIQQLREILPARERNRVVMGPLTYIAHSFHIFLESYAQEIARRIVSEAIP